MVPQTVEFPSGKVCLKAYLWKPLGPGPFPAVLFSHGSGGNEADLTAGMQIAESADILAPFFIKHGYAFLYPFRRGHGPSADQAPFMQDVLRQEEKERGREARQHLQFKLLTTDQLDDVMAALAFLKTMPGFDIHRIAVAGNSFGGQLALLAAERDSTIRAAVTFAAAAGSWERSAEVRDRLLTAVRKMSAAIMLIHAENDFSTLHEMMALLANADSVRTSPFFLERAKEKYPEAKPRIISDNGPQFIARDFKEFIRISGMTHVRTSPFYPQSNGKIERWHKSLKRECIRPRDRSGKAAGFEFCVAGSRRLRGF